ncbi:MAG: glycosyltransferase family 4 protein [Alphaproteobacteria bacterium]|nr:glycosyltransferase family 4 protein [Alphaproteobacteria bacterium]
MATPRGRLLFVINETWFFMSHRRPVAEAARAMGFEVHVAAPDDHVWAPKDFGVEALPKAGFTYHPIPLSRRGINPLGELRTLWALWRLYRRLRPDLVHHLTIKPVLYGGVVARLAGVPAVISGITGLGQVFVGRGPAFALLRAIAKLAYRWALGHRNLQVIVQNPEDGETLIAAGAIGRERVNLVRGSGVRLEDFPGGPEPAGVPLVILPARLIWEKGVAEFVEAAGRLRGRARFVLVGDTHPSNPRAVPEAKLRGWQDDGTVEWWGRRDDMPEVFAACHIVCLPSRYGEGVPKVLIEAASAGRAIVTTDMPGCREIVRHEENGLLVAPGAIDPLVEALARLIEDPALRARLGAAGRRIVAEGFSTEEVVRRTLAVYERVLRPAR